MQTPTVSFHNNKKLHSYNNGRCMKLQYLSGKAPFQHAMALADGFRWVTSTYGDDVFFTDRFGGVFRAICKESGNFREIQS